MLFTFQSSATNFVPPIRMAGKIYWNRHWSSFHTWLETAFVLHISSISCSKICLECHRALPSAALSNVMSWQMLVHRLPELVLHIVPLYSHRFLCQKWCLKQIISLSDLPYPCAPNQRGHIWTVNLILSKDWLSRPGSLFEIVKGRAGEERRRGMVGLITHFSGGAAHRVHRNMPQAAGMRADIEQFTYNVPAG